MNTSAWPTPRTRHWWYGATRALLTDVLGPYVRTGGRFLDAGGGTGATGAWLADHGQLVAVDTEPQALAIYAENHRAVSAGAAADVAALPLAAEAFDAVLCVTVLCHRLVTSPAAAVEELVRVTRRGGVVCLLEPGRAGRFSRPRPGHAHRSAFLSRRTLSIVG